MRRTLSMLLILGLLLAGLPAALAELAIDEPAPALPDEAFEQDSGALPAVGDVVHGFEVVEIREFALIAARVVRFEHKKTGAELYYIANDDTNRVFDLMFFTDAIDDTGLPHVFEHATLSGSEKYPSRSLFFNLSNQTYNTYMNAMTGTRDTNYPCASLSEAQLLKLADFYIDSCLHPMLMQDEDIFRTEAWRYRLEHPEDDLTLEGTVYSEMRGATTLERFAWKSALRAAFPGSMIGNESGGDPDFIPDMTWQMLKDYHDLYYHPSNCAAYLYGQFEDYGAFLELLDGYFSAYERKEFAREDAGYTPIGAPVVQSLPFPVEEGSDTEHTSEVYYVFVCPGLSAEPEQELLMNTFTDLIVDGASDFQQSLQKALPYGSFGSYIELDAPEDAVVFYAGNVNPEDADTFAAIVEESVAKVAREGFPQDQVDGVMASLNISAQLIRESGNVGIEGVVVDMADSYAGSGNPWSFIEYEEGLTRMDDWNRAGMYAEGASRWLLDSRTTALVTAYPQPGAKEAKDAALAERLAEVKAAMSEEEIAAIVEATNAEKPEGDSGEYLARLKAVGVEELPEEIKLYDVSDETDESGVRHIDAVAAMDGIGQTRIMLDAIGVAQEDIHWFQLYTNLIGELDTTAHTKAELAKLMSRYLYGGSFGMSTLLEGEDAVHPYFTVGWIALDEDLDEGYDLVRELLYETRLDDPDRLKEQVQSVRSGMKNGINNNPGNTLLRRGLAITQPRYRYVNYASGLDYYAFLGEVEQRLDSGPDAVVAKLQAIQRQFNNRTGAVALFGGNADSIALNRGLADAFLAKLDEFAIEPAQLDLPVPAESEALIIESGVQHNVLLASYGQLGLDGFNGGMDAVTRLVEDRILFPVLRDQYGVYTPMHAAMLYDGGIYVYAYRDPNVAETFQVLDGLAESVAELELDQEDLDGYILSAYSNYAMSQGELSGAMGAADDALRGREQGQALEWMRQLKQLTTEGVKDYAGLYASLSDNGARMTAGNASAVNANADLFDGILNPFGAVDTSQIELSDAAEGSEHYEAVRFAFEEGLMDPVEEDRFGVDEPATAGDLYAAINVIIGGNRDAEDGRATLSEYGLADPGADLAAPMDPAEFWDLASALMGEAVEPMTETADPASATRGELAEMLKAFLDSLG